MPIDQWLTDVVTAFREYLPELLGAGAVMLTGVLIAQLLRLVAARLAVGSVARLEQWRGLGGALLDSGARAAMPRVVGGFVFWLVVTFALGAALETLGLEVISGVVQRLAIYLPNVLGAVAVVGGGLIVGRLLRPLAAAAARSAGIRYADAAGRAARSTVLVVAVVIALDQVGVDSQLLVVLIAVVVGAGFAGAGLAFGLGAQTSVSNIIAAHYVAQTYEVGQIVRIAGFEGRVLRALPSGILLEAADGQVLVPARKFNEEISVLVTGRS